MMGKWYGYWASEDNIIAEAEKAMKEQGWDTIPGEKTLKEHGYGPMMSGARKYHNGLPGLRKLLGHKERLLTEPGRWQSEEYIIQQAQKAMQEQGWPILPVGRNLRVHGYAALETAAYKHHGGLQGVRILLGQPKRVPKPGKWKDPSYITEQARKAMQEQGWTTLPPALMLKKNGYGKLVSGADIHHNGLPGLRKLLGQENPREEFGVWKNIDFVLQQAQEAMEKEGWETLPSSRTLNKHGYNQILNSANKYHNGIPGLRKLLGQQERLRRKVGLWENQEYLLQQAQEAMQEQDWTTLPSTGVLRKVGYGPIAYAAKTYHGGISELRKLLGKNKEYIVQEALKAMQEQGWTTLPSSEVLAKNGYSALCSAVKHHGGFTGLRKLLGQESLKRPNGIWKSQEYTLQQARQAMEKEGWAKLPSTKILEKHGYFPLLGAASKYYGGLRGLRKLLGQPENLPKPGKWKDPAYITEQALKAMQEQGWTELPSGMVLKEKGYGCITDAANRYYNGLPGLRTLLGQENPRKGYGLWKDQEFILQEALKAMQKEGWERLPTTQVLRKHGYEQLIAASYKHHDGIRGLRRLVSEHMNQPSEQEQLEVLVGGYGA